MGDGEMFWKHSTIDINYHSEMVNWLNGAISMWWDSTMTKCCNSTIPIDKWWYGETERGNWFKKIIYSPVITQLFPYLITYYGIWTFGGFPHT